MVRLDGIFPECGNSLQHCLIDITERHGVVIKYKELVLTALALPSIFSAQAVASTCSCAAVPLLGTMQLASPDDNQWFLAATYDYHDASDLVSGSTSIPDSTGRERTTQAFVLEASRGLTEKWSFSALMSVVEHRRNVGGVEDVATGLGDAIVMIKYAPVAISLYSANAVSFGLGARLPIGVDDADRNGITLAEDMQPSTGAYGGILWGYAAHALNDSRNARLYGSFTYTYNGDNQRNYQFGHETTLTIGGAYKTQTPWGFTADILFRHAERDQRNSVDIPNTGGRWLDFIPAVQYHATESIAMTLAGKIPIRRDLNDALQFTTKYSVRFSVAYVFGG